MRYSRLFNRAKRRALKMSQGALGEALNTNATTICWYEHGKNEELEARLDQAITHELVRASIEKYGKRKNKEQYLFLIQVWLYYREELKREDLLTEEADAEIREEIQRWVV